MRKLLEEIMQIDQEDAAEQPVEKAIPEITPELMASLVEQMPELADVDQTELEKGLKVEMEHLATVGDDMLTVAKIALDHIKEFSGKSYYDALAQMEEELKETPGEEEAEHASGGDEEGGEPPLETKDVNIGEAETPFGGDTGADADAGMGDEYPEETSIPVHELKVGDVLSGGGDTPDPVASISVIVVLESGQEVEWEMTSTIAILTRQEVPNEEAQKMVDSGEAVIPQEAIVTEAEATKE